jgi:hypothetical protein
MEPTVYGRLARVEDTMGESKEYVTEASYGFKYINGKEYATLSRYLPRINEKCGVHLTKDNLPYLHDVLDPMYKAFLGVPPRPSTLENGTVTTLYGKEEMNKLLTYQRVRNAIAKAFRHTVMY